MVLYINTVPRAKVSAESDAALVGQVRFLDPSRVELFVLTSMPVEVAARITRHLAYAKLEIEAVMRMTMYPQHRHLEDNSAGISLTNPGPW